MYSISLFELSPFGVYVSGISSTPNPLNDLGGVLPTRNVDRWTDTHTHTEQFLYVFGGGGSDSDHEGKKQSKFECLHVSLQVSKHSWWYKTKTIMFDISTFSTWGVYIFSSLSK